MTKFNVYIFNEKGGAEQLVGSNMLERKADQRVITVLGRIDRDNYFVGSCEVDSQKDKDAKESLKLTKKD